MDEELQFVDFCVNANIMNALKFKENTPARERDLSVFFP